MAEQAANIQSFADDAMHRLATYLKVTDRSQEWIDQNIECVAALLDITKHDALEGMKKFMTLENRENQQGQVRQEARQTATVGSGGGGGEQDAREELDKAIRESQGGGGGGQGGQGGGGGRPQNSPSANQARSQALQGNQNAAGPHSGGGGRGQGGGGGGGGQA